MGHQNSHQELSSGPPTDFDVQVQASAPQQTVEDGWKNGGKYLVKIDKTMHGTINGGGPELQFTNFNGGIYIRKAGPRGDARPPCTTVMVITMYFAPHWFMSSIQ